MTWSIFNFILAAVLWWIDVSMKSLSEQWVGDVAAQAKSVAAADIK